MPEITGEQQLPPSGHGLSCSKEQGPHDSLHSPLQLARHAAHPFLHQPVFASYYCCSYSASTCFNSSIVSRSTANISPAVLCSPKECQRDAMRQNTSALLQHSTASSQSPIVLPRRTGVFMPMWREKALSARIALQISMHSLNLSSL